MERTKPFSILCNNCSSNDTVIIGMDRKCINIKCLTCTQVYQSCSYQNKHKDKRHWLDSAIGEISLARYSDDKTREVKRQYLHNAIRYIEEHLKTY